MSIILPTFSLLDWNQCFNTKYKSVHTVLTVSGNVIKEMSAVACPSFHSKTEGKVGMSCLILNSFPYFSMALFWHIYRCLRELPLLVSYCVINHSQRCERKGKKSLNEGDIRPKISNKNCSLLLLITR